MRLPITATMALTCYIIALLSVELSAQFEQGSSIQDLATHLNAPARAIVHLIRLSTLMADGTTLSMPAPPVRPLRSTCRGYTAA